MDNALKQLHEDYRDDDGSYTSYDILTSILASKVVKAALEKILPDIIEISGVDILDSISGDVLNECHDIISELSKEV